VSREFLVIDLGLRGYAEALSFQRDVAAARIDRRMPQDVLLLVEHPPVITLGRSTKAGNLLASSEALAARGVELFEVERGGDVTFHGPGQLVGYPIVDLTEHRQDLHWYLRQVEEVLIRAVAPFGVTAARDPGRTGIWTRGRKLASIGVHARQWVTWHGFALNVTTDLSYFDLMVPCGLPGVDMTSVEREMLEGTPDGRPCLATPPGLMDDVLAATVHAFAAVFDREPKAATMGALQALMDGPARPGPGAPPA
jgi:lipoate-protein ligase B